MCMGVATANSILLVVFARERLPQSVAQIRRRAGADAARYHDGAGNRYSRSARGVRTRDRHSGWQAARGAYAGSGSAPYGASVDPAGTAVTASGTPPGHCRRRAGSDAAIASYDAAVAGYRQTTLTAFQQVEDNLAALRVLEKEVKALGGGWDVRNMPSLPSLRKG